MKCIKDNKSPKVIPQFTKNALAWSDGYHFFIGLRYDNAWLLLRFLVTIDETNAAGSIDLTYTRKTGYENVDQLIFAIAYDSEYKKVYVANRLKFGGDDKTYIAITAFNNVLTSEIKL